MLPAIPSLLFSLPRGIEPVARPHSCLLSRRGSNPGLKARRGCQEDLAPQELRSLRHYAEACPISNFADQSAYMAPTIRDVIFQMLRRGNETRGLIVGGNGESLLSSHCTADVSKDVDDELACFRAPVLTPAIRDATLARFRVHDGGRF